MFKKRVIFELFVQLFQLQLEGMIEPKDDILHIHTQYQTLLHCDDSMRKVLAETPDLITKGLPLLKIFQKLFFPIPLILLPIVMLIVSP